MQILNRNGLKVIWCGDEKTRRLRCQKSGRWNLVGTCGPSAFASLAGAATRKTSALPFHFALLDFALISFLFE